ncbi:IreB family regulatory phosphoprotein [Oenococcus alcoholitolerans]|uniref:UPF0297 protein Q757_02830 n=1 Tax=Oenococcus alcoholitolerans TaxID=931074 RepID=A0ABR4XSK6_9LACO|nr:hypothetical protein Q757_02830 [Oenococcus alcoholitolerans]
MAEFEDTTVFDFGPEKPEDVRSMLRLVYQALEEKGYNPINQIVGYLISGDPAYIPRLNGARNLIRRFQRDEIVEELVKNYINDGSRLGKDK